MLNARENLKMVKDWIKDIKNAETEINTKAENELIDYIIFLHEEMELFEHLRLDVKNLSRKVDIVYF